MIMMAILAGGQLNEFFQIFTRPPPTWEKMIPNLGLIFFQMGWNKPPASFFLGGHG